MNIIIRNSDNVIIMFSPNSMPDVPDGCRSAVLTEEQIVALQEAFSTPNGGVTFDDTTFNVLPPPPPPEPVSTCTPWQFREELRALGIKTEVEALIAASNESTQEAYRFATTFESNNPLLLQLAALLSTPLNKQQIYDLIVSASQRKIGL